MMLQQQVFAQAMLLAGDMEGKQADLLNMLCTAATASLGARLREGLTPEDCKVEFIAAASLLALAGLNETYATGKTEEFKAGDLTVKRSSKDPAYNCLYRQAEMLIQPYLQDTFAFRGV